MAKTKNYVSWTGIDQRIFDLATNCMVADSEFDVKLDGYHYTAKCNMVDDAIVCVVVFKNGVRLGFQLYDTEKNEIVFSSDKGVN